MGKDRSNTRSNAKSDANTNSNADTIRTNTNTGSTADTDTAGTDTNAGGPQPTDPENGSDPENKKTTTKRIVRCRFISSQYFEDEHENLIPQERGGLAPDSVWATDSVRRQILRYALRKA